MATKYRVGSFNIQKFGRLSRKKKDVKNIADIIKKYQLDIVALQEISHYEALRDLLFCIDGFIINEKSNIAVTARDSYSFETKNWEGRWAKPISQIGGKQAEEGYAFIWKKQTIEIPSEPDIKRGRIIRPPFYGRFKLKNCNAEIRLINTHIIYKRKPLEDLEFEDEETTSNDYEQRLREYCTLASEIYRDVYTKPVVNRQVLAFILGDYNMCLADSESIDKKSVMPLDIQVYKTGKTQIKTIQNQKTTLRCKSRKDPDKVYYGEDNLANNYDHFSYDIKLDESIEVRDQRIDMQYIYEDNYFELCDNNGISYRNEYEAYKGLISDHLPIMITISISKRGE